MYRPYSGSLLRHFPTQFVMPILLLLGSSFGCLLVLLFHMTMDQDRTEHLREAELIGHSFTLAADMLEHDLQDYARWDDAVRHLQLRVDPQWADQNISPYLGTVQGYDHVMALGRDGRAFYVFSHGKRQRPGVDAGWLFGRNFASDVERVRTIPASGNPVLSGFSRAGDRIYAYTVASIIPLTGAVKPPPGPAPILVLARRIDPPFVTDMVRRHRLPAFRLTDQPREAGTLPLVGRRGQRVAWINWTPDRPGTELRRSLLPASAIIGLIAMTAAGLILRRAGRGMDALRRSQAQARYDSLHDPLTGLGNRRAMVEALHAGDGPITLFYMDLDGFKETNDVYGHAAGDDLLREAGRRIADAAPDARLVARSGGDEFALILDAPAPGRPQTLVSNILDAFQAPFAIGGYSVSAGISIGSAENAGCTPDEVIRCADVAMYAAKLNGKDCWCSYQPEMDEAYVERRALERDLYAAIEADAIEVMFQPIVEAASGRAVAVEALARWTHPNDGPISPDVFIRVAERSGLINKLGRNVLTIACREAIDWNLDLAVNLSPMQFWDRSLVSGIRAVLAQTGFPATRLELEITEGHLLRRPDAAEEILRELRELGVRIALDDFGTGFASIGYLRRLSLNRIKIDRSFVTDVARDSRAAEMARAIVSMAEALQLEVTAEGIETSAQAQIMRVIGCARLQGWLFGRPMTAGAATAWLDGACAARA